MRNKDYPFYETPCINNLKELVEFATEKYTENNAFTFEREKEIINVSYIQFKTDIDAIAKSLIKKDINCARIAVIGENSYEWILTYFAAVNSGNVIVPLDRELTCIEIKKLIDASNVEVFIYSNEFETVASYLKENGVSIKHFIPIRNFAEIVRQNECICAEEKGQTFDCEIDNHKMATILYTSGTTGTAKGVMLSQMNIAHDAVAACEHVGIFGSNMLVLPLHHSFGFTAGVCAMLLKGSEIYINSSLKNILNDLERFRPSNMFLVPLFVETFFKKIWNSAKKQNKDGVLEKLIAVSNAFIKVGIDMRRVLFKSVLKPFGGNLKVIVCGGAPLDTKYITGFRAFGVNVLNGYGITECSPIVSVNRNNYFRDGSIGPVLPCCEVKLLEEDDNGQGEICVKGKNVMLGYYNNTQETNSAFIDGWFKTGDIGYFDKDGFLFITGRKKNVIVLSNGKNVYPEELETALLRDIPYIKETEVYAENNIIVAEVFFNTESNLSCASKFTNDVIAFNRTLPPYMSIGKTVIREKEFPKTTTKKIKRKYNNEQHATYTPETEPLDKTEEDTAFLPEMISDSTEDVIMNIISAHLDEQPVTLESRLQYDLGLDSLVLVEICIDIEQAFNTLVYDNMGIVETVRDLVELIKSEGTVNHEAEYNIDDYPLIKTKLHIKKLKRYMLISRIAWRFNVAGLDNIPSDGRYILCPNHQSYLDSLWVWTAIGKARLNFQKICCLAAEVFLDSKYAMTMLGGIPVERYGNTIPALRRALVCLQEGYTMLIHPEGTRTRDGHMQKFKGGAAKLAIDANVPIIPVRIDGAWEIFPYHRKLPKIFRLGRRYPISISFGKKIDPNGKSIDELTSLVQNEVERLERAK